MFQLHSKRHRRSRQVHALIQVVPAVVPPLEEKSYGLFLGRSSLLGFEVRTTKTCPIAHPHALCFAKGQSGRETKTSLFFVPKIQNTLPLPLRTYCRSAPPTRPSICMLSTIHGMWPRRLFRCHTARKAWQAQHGYFRVYRAEPTYTVATCQRYAISLLAT